VLSLARPRRFKDGELNVGENSCIDRCAAKYWQASAEAAERHARLHSLLCFPG